MGIYYSSSLSYGILVDEKRLDVLAEEAEMGRTEFVEELIYSESTPSGIGFRESGGYDEYGDILVVINRLDHSVGGTLGNVFGAFRIHDLGKVTDSELSDLKKIADILGQEFDPDWYATFDCS